MNWCLLFLVFLFPGTASIQISFGVILATRSSWETLPVLITLHSVIAANVLLLISLIAYLVIYRRQWFAIVPLILCHICMGMSIFFYIDINRDQSVIVSRYISLIVLLPISTVSFGISIATSVILHRNERMVQSSINETIRDDKDIDLRQGGYIESDVSG